MKSKTEKEFRVKRDRLTGLNSAVLTTSIAEVMGSKLPPPHAPRFQSQTCEFEARETGDEHVRDHGKEKEAHHFRSERETPGNETGVKRVRIPFSPEFFSGFDFTTT